MRLALLVALMCLATPALSCDAETRCKLSDTVVLHEGATFCLNDQKPRDSNGDITVEKMGSGIYAVYDRRGIAKYYQGYAIARCLNSPIYLTEIATN